MFFGFSESEADSDLNLVICIVKYVLIPHFKKKKFYKSSAEKLLWTLESKTVR